MNRRSLLSVVAALPLIGRLARVEERGLEARAPGAEIDDKDRTAPNHFIDQSGAAQLGDRTRQPGPTPANGGPLGAKAELILRSRNEFERDHAKQGGGWFAPNATLGNGERGAQLIAGTAVSSSSDRLGFLHVLAPERAVERGVFSVVDFGARGDGSADDSNAILAAISAAGMHGEVIFPAGLTFRISRTLRPLAGQTWWGYGATLKRADEVSAKTSTSIPAGSQPTTLMFSSPHPFTVGESIALFDGPDFDPQNHTVQDARPFSIVVGSEFTSGYSEGGTVVRSLSMVLTLGDAPGVRIFGLRFDGNRANNASLQKWQLTASLQFGSERSIVRDCTFFDAQADAIMIHGDSSVAESNTVLDSTGNGIHLSTGRHIRVIGNMVMNCNLGGAQVGHADGCIIASDAVYDALIAGNTCENGISGIGSWDQVDNAGLVCIGNVIRNCTVSALDMLIPMGDRSGRVVFANNLVYNSKTVALNQVDELSPEGVGPHHVIIANNYFEDTMVTLRRCLNVDFSGNIMTASSDEKSTLVEVIGGSGIQISGNQLRGGGRGLVLKGRVVDVANQGNTCRDQWSYGISLQGDNGGNTRISGNTIASGTLSSESWYGIGETGKTGGAGFLIDDNVVDVSSSSAKAVGITTSRGARNIQGSIILNNVIRTAGSNGIALRLQPKSRNCIARGNLVRGAIENLGTDNSLLETVILLQTHDQQTEVLPSLAL